MDDTGLNPTEPIKPLNPASPLNPTNEDSPIEPAKRRDEAMSDYVQTLERERARLKAENEALVAEFRETVTEEWSADDVKKKIRDLMAIAYERMATLMVHADNEAVQAGLIKYVFNIGIGVIKVTDDNEADAEFKELLSAIKKTDPNTAKASTKAALKAGSQTPHTPHTPQTLQTPEDS